ncbi:unnamed protein product [Jaminaea pallidilutea]
MLSRLLNAGVARPSKRQAKAEHGSVPASSSSSSLFAGGSQGNFDSDNDYQTVTSDWYVLLGQLTSPDQAALHHGIARTDIPQRLRRIANALVRESTMEDEESLEGMGPCMEYVQRHNVLSIVVQAAIKDEPNGVTVEAVRFFQVLVANLDARFLSQQAVNKPLVRLIRSCVGDEDVDSEWGQDAGFQDGDDVNDEANAKRRPHPAHVAALDEALVGLMVFVTSKVYIAQELLHIFFHDRLKDRRRNGTAAAVEPPRPDSPASSNASVATVTPAEAVPLGSSLAPDGKEDHFSHDFPLFTYLLRFVHAEGHTGQLARAGLSMIVKIAFEAKSSEVSESPQLSSRRVDFEHQTDDNTVTASLDLAKYILQSDFVDVIAASLGAIYGLLPSKLAVSTTHGAAVSAASNNGGMSLGVQDEKDTEAERERQQRLGLESSERPDVRERLQLFADILDFVQSDVLERVVAGGFSDALTDMTELRYELAGRLISAVHVSLMRNIIYPSMVESGDNDGSAVAVMSYLEVLVWSLDDRSRLAEETVGWLILQGETPDKSVPNDNKRKQPRRGRKSAALSLLEQRRRRDEHVEFDPFLHYTMKSLLLDYSSSTTSSQSVTAALGLMNAIISRHGRFALHGLISVTADDSATAFPFTLPSVHTPSTTRRDGDAASFSARDISNDNKRKEVSITSIAQHTTEVDLYFSLVYALRGSKDSDQVDFATSTGFVKYLYDAEQALSQDPTYSYGLQHGMTAALHHARGQKGDAFDLEQHVPFRHRLSDGDPLLRSLLAKLRRFFEQPPELNVSLTVLLSSICLCPYRGVQGWLTFDWEVYGNGPKEVPILLELLRGLVAHVDRYRSQIANFDDFLAERRQGLLYVENLSDALEITTSEAGEGGEELTPNSFWSQPAGRSSAKERDLQWRRATGRSWSSYDATAVHDFGKQDHGNAKVTRSRLPAPSQNTKDPEAEARSQADAPSLTPAPQQQSSIYRLFGRPSRQKASGASQKDGQSATDTTALPAATPFADHYAQTAAINLTPLFLPMPKDSRWTRSTYTPDTILAETSIDSDPTSSPQTNLQKMTRFELSPKPAAQGESLSDDREQTESHKDGGPPVQVAYPGIDDDEEEEARRTRPRITLSHLLDNVVILEEFIKELTAILHVRRVMGIDAVRFREE